jgi:hypothetical protein
VEALMITGNVIDTPPVRIELAVVSLAPLAGRLGGSPTPPSPATPARAAAAATGLLTIGDTASCDGRPISLSTEAPRLLTASSSPAAPHVNQPSVVGT